MLQLGIIIAVVGGWLGWLAWRTWSARSKPKGGCGTGCGCGHS